MKRRFFALTFLIFLCFPKNTLVAQESSHEMDFIVIMPPSLYLNLQDARESAPSPILFPFTLGINWPSDTLISIEPTLAVYMMYYLWYDGAAVPATIETRTTTALSFILNVPAVFSFHFKRSKAQISAGVAMLMRFGWLSKDVKESDSGWNGNTASEDAKLINDYLWDNVRFLYASVGASWLFNLDDKAKIGPMLAFYLPLGSIFSTEGLNASIISVGLKVAF